MSEFAANPTGHNVHFGDCRNPWNVAHITGGSSSGPAAAVAARTCYAALGSDTGGSVRVPAAMCGVSGMKPTYGRISRANILPRAWSVDTVGVLARSAEDCAIVTGVVAGHDPLDPTTSNVPVPDYRAALAGPIEGIKVGVPADPVFSAIDADVGSALHQSLSAISALGAKIVEVSLPDFLTFAVVSDAITKCEAAVLHRRWLRSRIEDYSLFVRSRLEAGFHIPAALYLQGLANRGRVLSDFVRRVFDVVDVIHLPVLPMGVPTLAETDINSAQDVPSLIAKITSFTRPINYLGLPSLSVPCGFALNGLPIAFQLVGRPYSESLLFRLAHAYQRTVDWHLRTPPLGADAVTSRHQ
jgi:aspartyl-tRNA(Asn)/glutamyl-tRNA(Gln) amidotransferase subunit A